MTKESNNTETCNICNQPYGSCNQAAHETAIKRNDPRYGFGETTVETPYHKTSISPKASKIRTNEDGVEVADVNEVTFDN